MQFKLRALHRYFSLLSSDNLSVLAKVEKKSLVPSEDTLLSIRWTSCDLNLRLLPSF